MAEGQDASQSLAGRVVLVTGGGGGLGEATCRVLAAAGATVIAADLKTEAAQRVAGAVLEGGGAAAGLALDVTDEADVREVLHHVVEEHGRLDAVVNNAGVDVTAPVEELEPKDWARILAVNLTGPFLVSRAAFPLMRERGGGHIVNIVSTAAKRAWANASAYHASKWGLLGLSHGLHVEGRDAGIKVTAVIAGGMRTPFLLDRFPDIDQAMLQDPMNVAQTIRFVLTQPAETVIPEVMVLPMRESSWP